MPALTTTHIALDEKGVTWIQGTRIKVIEVALDKIGNGSSPEEIHFQYPHLSLAQIHSALAYYYDHEAEFDSEISRQLERIEQLAAQSKDSPGKKRLRILGLLPHGDRHGRQLKGRTLTRAQGRAFRSRWTLTNAAERDELRKTPIAQKLLQLASLMSSAKQLGWMDSVSPDVAQVRERWNRLRREYRVQS